MISQAYHFHLPSICAAEHTEGGRMKPTTDWKDQARQELPKHSFAPFDRLIMLLAILKPTKSHSFSTSMNFPRLENDVEGGNIDKYPVTSSPTACGIDTPL